MEQVVHTTVDQEAESKPGTRDLIQPPKAYPNDLLLKGSMPSKIVPPTGKQQQNMGVGDISDSNYNTDHLLQPGTESTARGTFAKCRLFSYDFQNSLQWQSDAVRITTHRPISHSLQMPASTRLSLSFSILEPYIALWAPVLCIVCLVTSHWALSQSGAFI